MPIVVGVSFKPLSKLVLCDPNGLTLAVDDAVVAEGENGHEFGVVKTPARAVPESDAPPPLRRVLRVATGDDWQRRERGESGRRKHTACAKKRSSCWACR